MRSTHLLSGSLILLALLTPVSLIGQSHSPVIITYAGPSAPANGTPALGHILATPTGVASDNAGGYYVASSTLHRVYRINAEGLISIVAGSIMGYGGDGGPATRALLSSPMGLAVDAAGNLYIADYGNVRVRRVSPDGVITTVVGNGTQGRGGDAGPATEAQLVAPTAIAIGPGGELYVADAYWARKVAPDGIISSIPIVSSWGIAVDARGTVYVSETNNSRVLAVTPDGTTRVIVGNGTYGFGGDGGPAISALVASPAGLALDSAGNLYIADTGNDRVRKVSTNGIITTIAGSGREGFIGDGGPATSAGLSWPRAVALTSSGDMLIADTLNNRVRDIDSTGIIRTVVGSDTPGTPAPNTPAPNTTAAALADIATEAAITVDAEGNVFLAEYETNRVRKISIDGTVSLVAGTGVRGFKGDWGPASAAQLDQPHGVAVDSAGNIYIADTGNSRIRVVRSNGMIETFAGNGDSGILGDGGLAVNAQLIAPVGVATDSDGSLFISDSVANTVRRVSANGIIARVAGNSTRGFSGDGGAATNAQLNMPFGVATDNRGTIYIADQGNNRIRKVAPTGVISTVAGNGASTVTPYSGEGGPATATAVKSPTGVAVDADGNVVFAEEFGSRVRKVTASETMVTIAGNGFGGSSGDDGPATSAQIVPYTVAYDRYGNLYIGDANKRVRKVLSGNLPSVGVFPQVASGGAWKTTIVLVNLANVRVSYRLSFRGNGGGSLVQVVSLPKATVSSDVIGGIIEPFASVTLECDGVSPEGVTGWAAVEADALLSGFAIFRYRTQGQADSEATMPLEASEPIVTLPFDNASNFKTGIALVNHSAEAVTIEVSIRDSDGRLIDRFSLSLTSRQHTAFFIEERWSVTKGKRGVVEFASSTGRVAAIGIRFSPTGSFTSIPTLR